MTNTRCEDYPCCGHTDGLPCNWTAPDYASDPHLLCDHENDGCDVDAFDPDVCAPEVGYCVNEGDDCDCTDEDDWDGMEDQWLDGSYEE